MRKILLTIANLLLFIALVLVMVKGFSISSLQVLGFNGLKNASEGLETKIDEVNQATNSYKDTLNTIQQDTQKLTKAKKDYLDLVSVSSASDIQSALQTKTYTIEYLWSRVGNYATKEGVTVTMSIESSTLGANNYKNLRFTVNGQYLAISQFIRDIENDSNLDFTIDSFDMKASEASFIVKDVKIQQESTSKATMTTSDSTSSGNKSVNNDVENATVNSTSTTQNDTTKD